MFVCLSFCCFKLQFLSDVYKVFVHCDRNSCFLRYYLIVFTKHYFVKTQTSVRKKSFIVFQNLSLSLIVIMSRLTRKICTVNPLVFNSFVFILFVFFSFSLLIQIFHSKTHHDGLMQSFTPERIFIGS